MELDLPHVLWCSMLNACIFITAISSSWVDHYIVFFLLFAMVFILKSLISYANIATPAFILFPFAWDIFFSSAFHLQSMCFPSPEVGLL